METNIIWNGFNNSWVCIIISLLFVVYTDSIIILIIVRLCTTEMKYQSEIMFSRDNWTK